MNHPNPTRPSGRLAITRHVCLGLAAALASACTHGTTPHEFSYQPDVPRPAYAVGEGPRVLIDESHCNYHTADGRYEPFAALLRSDGFTVSALTGGLSDASLADADVVVIANAMPLRACDRWRLPTPPAFRPDEITALERWVDAGGGLMLVADHMPFPGAAESLARAFGVVFINGYARPDVGSSRIRFERAAGTLKEHPITAGRSADERVEAVMSFTGQAFRAVRAVEPLLVLPAATTVTLPVAHSKVTARTPRFSAEGLLQGAVLSHGRGRVAVFGEAAMFTASEFVVDDELIRMGMNAAGAEDNAQFALNVMHWLVGLLES